MKAVVTAMEDLTGADGELIERLVALLRASEDVDPHRAYNAGVYVVACIGGRRLVSVFPTFDDEAELAADSVGAEMRRNLEPVPVTKWFELMRDRLADLVASGVAEDFLVKALRNYLTEMYEGLGDVGAGDRRREQTRGHLLSVIDDPLELERFRQSLAVHDPSVRDLHLDQIADRVRDLADASFLAPASVDQASERWAQLHAWSADAESLLSDGEIERWGLAAARRRLS